MPDEHTPSHLGAIGIALLVTVLWSSSWVLIRWGLDGEGLQPLTFAAARYGLAAIVVVAWILVRRPEAVRTIRHMDGRMVLQIVTLGVVMYSLTQGAQFVAIANQPAATTSLVLSWMPLLVAGLSAVSLSEIPSGRQVAGAVLVVVGAWAYFVGDLGATTVGMIAALVGLGSGAAASLLGRSVNRARRLPAVVVTGLSMAIGATVLAVVGVAVEGVPSISAKAWLIIAWLAVVNAAIAFTLWNLSLRRLSAVESAGINNTMLIQIAVLGWLFLGETPGVSQLVGIALVSIGVFLTQLFGPQRQRAVADRP